MSESVESSESWIAQRRAAAEAYADRVVQKALAQATVASPLLSPLLMKMPSAPLVELMRAIVVNAFEAGHEECARVAQELLGDGGLS